MSALSVGMAIGVLNIPIFQWEHLNSVCENCCLVVMGHEHLPELRQIPLGMMATFFVIQDFFMVGIDHVIQSKQANMWDP